MKNNNNKFKRSNRTFPYLLWKRVVSSFLFIHLSIYFWQKNKLYFIKLILYLMLTQLITNKVLKHLMTNQERQRTNQNIFQSIKAQKYKVN